MAAQGVLTVTYLSGLQTGVSEAVPISVAESLCMMGTAKLTTPGLPAGDPDPVFLPGPTLDK
jgi:hypothetical protein